MQLFVISGIARWNADRVAEIPTQERSHKAYSSDLIHRVNARCQKYFGKKMEPHFQHPLPATTEAFGLDYLSRQNVGVETFSVAQVQEDGPTEKDEVDQEFHPLDLSDSDEETASTGKQPSLVIAILQ